MSGVCPGVPRAGEDLLVVVGLPVGDAHLVGIKCLFGCGVGGVADLAVVQQAVEDFLLDTAV